MIQYNQPAEKTIDVDGDPLTLTNFNWNIDEYTHSFSGNTTVCRMQMDTVDGDASFIKDFEIPNPTSYTEQKLIDKLLTLDAFNGSNPV